MCCCIFVCMQDWRYIFDLLSFAAVPSVVDHAVSWLSITFTILIDMCEQICGEYEHARCKFNRLFVCITNILRISNFLLDRTASSSTVYIGSNFLWIASGAMFMSNAQATPLTRTRPCHAPIYAFWLHRFFLDIKPNDATAVCMCCQYSLLTFNVLPNYCSELLTPYKCYCHYMHEYHSSQWLLVTTLPLWFCR